MPDQRRFTLAFVLLSTAAAAIVADDAPAEGQLAADRVRGPAEIRDGQLLAQPRLTLPALSAATVTPGRWELRASVLWSNSFSWTQDVAGEAPEDRRFLIDGESGTVDLTLRRGLARNLDAGLRLALHGRGGGVLDGFIDFWHRLVRLPDGQRPDFRRDAFRVEGRTTAGGAFSWSDAKGWGLGDLELESRWRLADGAGREPSVALVARVVLPTGGELYSGGLGAGGQVAVDVPLGRRFDLFTGMGVTAQDPGPVRGIEYEPARLHGYLALEWRVARPLSLLVETNAASRLVRNVDRYPGTHWMVNVGGRLDLGGRTRLDAFVTENILSQLSTTDIALHVAVSVRP
jgi:hypothetical protein